MTWHNCVRQVSERKSNCHDELVSFLLSLSKYDIDGPKRF